MMDTLRINEIEEVPIHEITYLYPSPGGGTMMGAYTIQQTHVSAPQSPIQALFITSDLQGYEPAWQAQDAPRSLGEVVVEELALLAELGEIPAPDQIGILLAGDIFGHIGPDGRGKSGDASGVWQAFAESFAWVAGVPGNHDRFPDDFATAENIYYLDGRAEHIAGLKIAGLGGIIGKPTKPMRRAPDAYISTLNQLLADEPDILILHQGPKVPEKRYYGSELIRGSLEHRSEPLVISGHTHWSDPLLTFPHGLQVLNVEGRGILIHLGRQPHFAARRPAPGSETAADPD